MPTITTEMEAELIRLFSRFDRDGSGLIDEHEFRMLLEQLEFEAPDNVLREEFRDIDANGDERVTFSEFAEWWIQMVIR